MGVFTTSQIPVVVSTVALSSGVEESAPLKAKVSKISNNFQCQHITPTSIGPSSSVSNLSSSSSAMKFPVVVGSELALPAEAYPERINKPGGGKDYLCHLCLFRHSNLDSILTHVRKHLEVTIGFLCVAKGIRMLHPFVNMVGMSIVSK